jgi:oligosaccharyltransferase complex subunit alpha (ribophorin I)
VYVLVRICIVLLGTLLFVVSFVQSELTVHYENNTPFLTVTRMTRVIELSHWGNIAVEETFDLIHSGAVLKGSFSRYDYQRNQDGINSVKSFRVSCVIRMLYGHSS